MSNTVSQTNVTAKQIAAMPDDGHRYELIQGDLHMMSPAGGRHGRIASKLLTRIAVFVEQRGLGHTFAAETGFILETNPDTVRAPDVAFISTATFGDFLDYDGYLPVVPELVAEVVSPHDRSSDVEEKANAWLDAGVQVVLVVDPQAKSIGRYASGHDIQLARSGMLDLESVIPGFQLNIDELFS